MRKGLIRVQLKILKFVPGKQLEFYICFKIKLKANCFLTVTLSYSYTAVLHSTIKMKKSISRYESIGMLQVSCTTDYCKNLQLKIEGCLQTAPTHARSVSELFGPSSNREETSSESNHYFFGQNFL